MLKGTNDNILQKLGIDQSHYFFYQRWLELLELKTLDMYQYNILNTCVALDEFQNVIEKTIDGVFLSRQNIDDAQAETLSLLKDDDILNKYNYHLKTMLLKLVASKIDSKRMDGDEIKKSAFITSLNRIKHALKTPCSILRDNYLKYILNILEEDINRNDNRNMQKHMSILISQCLFMGWSSKGLLNLAGIFKKNQSVHDKWEEFKTCISKVDLDKFTIYYGVRLEASKKVRVSDTIQTVQDLGITIKKGQDINKSIINSLDMLPSSILKADSYYAVIDVYAKDEYSAVFNAINKLNSKISIATFYNTIDPWIASNPKQIYVFDYKGASTMQIKMTEVFKTYDYLDSANNTFYDTKNIMKGNNRDLINKLNPVFAYTNLSRASIFQETKFITLWIALESIMKTGFYPDIISHIKEVLPKALGLRYFYKVIRNFAEDCVRCQLTEIESLKIKIKADDKINLVKHLMNIFRDNSMYEILQRECEKKKALLAFRCSEIHEIVNDPQKMLDKIKHYKQKIEWHVQRLYRIRNEITHQAFSNEKSLVIYIEHTYSFLSQLIAEIVNYVEHKNAMSLEHALSAIVADYDTYLCLMENNDIELNALLEDGIIKIS